MIVLYHPQSNAGRKCVLPISLLALGAVLEREHDYLIIDGNIEHDPLAKLDTLICSHAVGVLGVTVMPGPQLHQAVPICRELKRRHPGLVIVWGGYFPTQHYDACLRAPYVDYVVRGHGERVFKQLLDALVQGNDPTTLPGLAYRSPETGAVIANPMAPIPHPNELPDFPYHRVEMPRYARQTFMGKRTFSHHSSYGCPFSCNFCAVVNMVKGRWLAQSAERTARTVRYLVETFNADSIEFYDNNFFVAEERVAEFAERIHDSSIGWWGEARIDTLLKYPDRTWKRMAASGLRMVFLGAESGSDETLRRMDKGGTATTAKTLEIAAKMKDYGIVPEFSFVLGNPPNPEADSHATLEFIRKVKRVNPTSEIIMYVYTPVPLAGDLYDQARAEGFQFPTTLDEWVSHDWAEFSQRRSTHVPWLNDPLRRRLRDFERVLNAYYPTTTDTKLTPLWRALLKAASAWRYHLRFYQYPLELRGLQKFLHYQRPETTGF